MKEAIDSIKDALKGRLTNPAYGAFIIYWIIFHWQFIFSLFALDQTLVLQSTGLLKNVYLSITFFNVKSAYFWFSWVMPFVLTYITIWKLPKWILLPAFESEEKYKAKKREIKIRNEKALESEQAQLEVAKTTTLEAVAKKTVKEKEVEKIINPTQDWLDEYKEFKKSTLFSYFNLILDSIYTYSGSITVKDGYQRIIFQVPKEILAYSHTNNLIELDKTRDKIELTEKGKFFIKEYSSKN